VREPRTQPVASVRQLEQDERIILGKLKAPNVIDSSKVTFPWYPADVRARAMSGYAGSFTSRRTIFFIHSSATRAVNRWISHCVRARN